MKFLVTYGDFMFYLRILLIILILFTCSVAFAQINSSLEIQRINGDIVLDGLSNEEAWEEIMPLPLVMYQPVFRGKPTQKTEILVAYDEDYLYLAGRFYYTDPSKISMNTYKRDGFSNSDCFNMIIDSYNDNENALYFMTTPAGLRRDCIISNDGEGNWMNLSWNTFWDTQSVVNDEGWFAEVRIPFSSLRFQDVNGEVTMGLLVHRYFIKNMERVTFPAVSPEITSEPFKPSSARNIKFKGIYSTKPVYITPYFLSGVDRGQDLNSIADRYIGKTNEKFDGGLDIKYSLASNLTLDLTANTDFAQVEADDEQVNLTRFSLFFPEKRQFFQERSSIFEFGTGGISRLFHSRRIGLTDNGESIRIYGGARIVGRMGLWDVGFLDMQTEKTGDTPSENFGVLRLRRRVINPFSYVGGMVTSRIGHDGSYNTVLGLDGTVRIKDDDYFLYNWAQTFEKDQVQNIIDRGRIRVRWERRKIRGFVYRTEFVGTGAHYNPGMGFIFRSDFLSGSQYIAYGWTPSSGSKLRNYRLSTETNAIFRKEYDELETLTFGGGMFFEYKSGVILSFGGNFSHENIFERFYIIRGKKEVYVPEGKHNFGNLYFNFGLGEGRKISPFVNLQLGKFYDGTIVTGGLYANWYLSKHFNFSTNYTVNRIKFKNRGQIFVSHLAGWQMEYTLNTKLSINSFLQYNSVSDKFITNVRFRYNFSEGNDLYIVYNEMLNTDRDIAYPCLPFSDNRTVVLKITTTFIK